MALPSQSPGRRLFIEGCDGSITVLNALDGAHAISSLFLAGDNSWPRHGALFLRAPTMEAISIPQTLPISQHSSSFQRLRIKDEIEVSIRVSALTIMAEFEDWVSALTIMAEFEDFLPIMAQNLGEREFMAEVCNGFRLLADPRLGLITLESLKKNSGLLGLDSLTDSELRAMMQEGDLDGDEALNEHEFCVLMMRLSPSLMDEAYKWLNNALENDLEEFPEEK